jgi:predicted peroxiredoxin
MRAVMTQEAAGCAEEGRNELFIVLCASGFENIPRVRSALMFAALAASANYRTILYCIQNAVDVMVRGAVEERERPQPGVPSLARRLCEALDMGVEIQCCTQTMANKNISEAELLGGVKPAGAMSLIDLTSQARGSLCF